jgi:hypothetical protein
MLLLFPPLSLENASQSKYATARRAKPGLARREPKL